MIPHPSLHWNEILAAYADGEFEGRDDLTPLKLRVEDWLTRHPEARTELAEYRRLKQLWQDTAPTAPKPSAWQRVARNLEAAPHRAAKPRTSRWPRYLGVAAALAACVAVVVLLAPGPRQKVREHPGRTIPEADYEVFSVASMAEVEILRVDGADTGTLVVGALPVHGSLELAGPGDVTVTSVEPDSHDNMVPMVRVAGPRRPLIWARLDSE